MRHTLYLTIALLFVAPTFAAECTADTKGAGGGCVNLNTADAATLQTLHRVGPVTAEKIIAYREIKPFTGVYQLADVPGIGPLTVCYNQRAVVLDGESSRSTKYKPEEEIVTACKATTSPADHCFDC